MCCTLSLLHSIRVADLLFVFCCAACCRSKCEEQNFAKFPKLKPRMLQVMLMLSLL